MSFSLFFLLLAAPHSSILHHLFFNVYFSRSRLLYSSLTHNLFLTKTKRCTRPFNFYAFPSQSRLFAHLFCTRTLYCAPTFFPYSQACFPHLPSLTCCTISSLLHFIFLIFYGAFNVYIFTLLHRLYCDLFYHSFIAVFLLLPVLFQDCL